MATVCEGDNKEKKKAKLDLDKTDSILRNEGEMGWMRGIVGTAGIGVMGGMGGMKFDLF